jgi:2'-hydroxyisoflavone reductase
MAGDGRLRNHGVWQRVEARMRKNASRRQFLTGAAAGLVGLASCSRRGGDAATTTPATPDPVTSKPDVRASEGPRTLLVLGGTGFIGPHIVEGAIARGWKVTLFNRGKTRPELFPDVEKLRGDRDGDLKALEGRQWDAVIDTSGYVPRIVKASAELLAENVKQYVFVSSVSAYGDFGKPNIAEDHPVATMEDPTNEEVMKNYGALKALCEQAAEKALPGRTTNVRPGYIVGPLDPTDRFTYWPVRVAKGGEMIAPGKPDDVIQFIDARDLAAWTLGAIEKRHVGIYNLVGPSAPMPMGDFLQTCIDAAKSDTKLVWVDTKFLIDKGSGPGGDLPIWVPSDDPEWVGFARISNAKAVATGLTYRSPHDTVADTLAYWSSLPDERRAKMRAGWPAEKEAEMLAAWRAKDKPAKKGKKAKPKAATG